MKKKLSALLPYAAALAVIYYGLPFLTRDTGSGMLFMLLVVPVLTFLCAVVYGVRHGFSPWFALAAAVLFAPSIFIFYNGSAWIYIVVYAVVALAGNGIGRAFRRK